MSAKADLAIRGAVVISDGAFARDILIRDGRISALVEAGASAANREIEARGLLALPGMVDAHVHFNEPGRTDWEGWASGTRAAAAGGTTTVLDMPLNSVPPVLDGASFDVKKAAAEKASIVDFGLWGGLVDADPASLRELSERGAVGVKAFLCDSGVAEFPALHEEDLVPALRRIHIVHLSAMEALGAVGAARDMGTDVSVETCPHYLTFDESDLTRQGASLKCAPPIRDGRNRDGLWRALLDGKIDFVASDHSPCPPDLKASADMFAAWGGVAGAQSLLPAVFAGASARAGDALDVRKVAGFVVWRLAARPAKRFGLWPRKGAIAPGSDADVVLFDPDREWTLDAKASRTRGVDPYIGRSFRGKVVRTLVGGRTVYNERETVPNPARGRFIPRGEVAEG